jgi:hypothetical protein
MLSATWLIDGGKGMAEQDPGGPGTLVRGDLVATNQGLLWVTDRRETQEQGVVYVGLTLPVRATEEGQEVEFQSADVMMLYRPTWRRR